MAMVNGRLPPKQTRAVLEQIYKEEQESRRKNSEYTYKDLFTGRKQAMVTLIFCFKWFMFSAVFYGISFGVSALSGNLYLNMFLLSVIELPVQFTTFYFNNRFGRKKTSIALLVLGLLPACGCLVVYSVVESGSRGGWITGFSLASKMGIAAAWAANAVWVIEIYPTVVRNLGYGIVNMAARIGGIVAPFAIDLDNSPFVAYAVITSTVTISIFLTFLLPDTKNKLLPDSMKKTISSSSSSPPPSKHGHLELAIVTTMDTDKMAEHPDGSQQQNGDTVKDKAGLPSYDEHCRQEQSGGDKCDGGKTGHSNGMIVHKF